MSFCYDEYPAFSYCKISPAGQKRIHTLVNWGISKDADIIYKTVLAIVCYQQGWKLTTSAANEIREWCTTLTQRLQGSISEYTGRSIPQLYSVQNMPYKAAWTLKFIEHTEAVLFSENTLVFRMAEVSMSSAIALGEGNGNPLQYSCLENPMDRGAWQATVHGVTKSWTRLSV